LIEVTPKPGLDSEAGDVEVEFIVRSLTSTEIEIQLEFKKPNLISTNQKADEVTVTLNLEAFKDEYGDSLPSNLILQAYLP